MNPVFEIHKSKVKQFLTAGKAPTFPIEDTCRLDNFGILKLPENLQATTAEWVGLIPAAGAASRYVAPLAALALAAKQKNAALVKEQLNELRKQGAEQWPLPDFLKDLFKNGAKIEGVFDQLSEIADFPKAFFPAVIEGQTFFELKCIEHNKMEMIESEVFVTPRDKSQKFEKMRAGFETKNLPATFIEQGESLSTVRFTKTLDVAKDLQGKPSLVPAGHGALIAIFPEIKRKFPSAQFALIRNIDSVIGTSRVVMSDSAKFMNAVNWIHGDMSEMRHAVKQNQLDIAAKKAVAMAERLGIGLSAGKPNEVLISLMKDVFHTPQSALSSKSIFELFDRPLNVLGMVPNLGSDVGGTPCFVNIDGETVKLCLEVPHAEPKDKSRFLERADLATHFNPVWVAAELFEGRASYPEDHPFWLISKKQYLGEEVYYFESLLYEILSCSTHSNILFFEIPRRLFNPHKALQDAMGRKVKDWL